jgi:hypothetical protein
MARKRLVECSFLIPIRGDRRLSDGLPHERRAWMWLRRRLYEFEGATRARELYEGWYVDADTRQPVKDVSRKYFVALERRQLAVLRALLREACGVFAQKCIYLSVAGKVEFVQG